MTRVIYIGSFDAVDVPDLGIVGLRRGEPTEELHEEAAERLLEQADWTTADAAPLDTTPVPTTEEDLEA